MRCNQCDYGKDEDLPEGCAPYVEDGDAWRALPFIENPWRDEHRPGHRGNLTRCHHCRGSGFIFVPNELHSLTLYADALRIAIVGSWIQWLYKQGWLMMYNHRTLRNAVGPTRDSVSKCQIWIDGVCVCGPNMSWELPKID